MMGSNLKLKMDAPSVAKFIVSLAKLSSDT